MADEVEVVDAVGAGGHARDDGQGFGVAVRADGDSQVDAVVDQVGQVDVFGQPDQGDQSGAGHESVVGELC
ncbi:hypothetical protein [Amycolatopsis sp.]|uniref:hypothetical protein n=1 Tax=Amycolatopsis sp. TaxID=37632 RepID=UPI0039C8B9D3